MVQGPILAAAGYFTPIDGFQHTITATSDGRLYGLSFNPQQGIFQDTLGCFSGILAIAGFVTPGDFTQHIIVVAGDGDVLEIQVQPVPPPAQPISEQLLTSFPSTGPDLADHVIGVAGFYDSLNRYNAVLVGRSDGTVNEVVYFYDQDPFTRFVIQLEGITHIAGFFASDDNSRHVIIATSDGNVHDVTYSATGAVATSVDRVLTRFEGIIGIAGFFTSDDNYRHVIVATFEGNVQELYYDLNVTGGQPGVASLANFQGIVSIAGYFTPDNGNRHVIVATENGTLYEVYFNPLRGISQDVLTTFTPLPSTMEDISPNTPNGSLGENASTAGVIIGLAGNEYTLYALSLNAGVWRSAAGGLWMQLANSPRYGCCIAVDPNDPFHVVVGERDGNAVSPSAENVGLWESYDAGDSWAYAFSPLSQQGCTSQAIPAVAFGPTSTLFIGTVCGIIGRRRTIDSEFDFTPTPPGLGMVTAFSASESNIWARTTNQLLVSPDDGSSWPTVKSIPQTITIPQTVIGSTFVPAGIYTIITNSAVTGGNDFLSLAAIDPLACIMVSVFVPPSSPIARFDPTCDPSSSQYNPQQTNCVPTGNHNILLIYNMSTDTWQVQILVSNSGLGLGGRRFVKSYNLARPDLPWQIGERLQLFNCGADDVMIAQGIQADGTILWDTKFFALTFATGSNRDRIHSDMWDFHLAPDGNTAWIACDGGVYQKSVPSGSWEIRNDGLHTHHVHTLTVLSTNDVSRPRLAYPTTDNDAWFRDSTPIVLPPAQWQHNSSLGDANWSAGDAANPALTLFVRNPRQAVLTAFGETPPAGADVHEGRLVTLNNDTTFDGPLFLQFIQTLSIENLPFYSLLDAVMLANLPLTDAKGNPVPGPLGQPNPRGNPVLIRNTAFAKSPNANVSNFQTWQIESNNLPAGTQGFWVSGGHEQPTYYVFAAQMQGLVLFKKDPFNTIWQPLNVSGLLGGGTFGPAFINPYNPDHLFVLTATGIKVSVDGGRSFQDDDVLTRLVTGSGRFSLVGNFSDDPQFSAVGSRGRASPIGTLSHIAFSREDSNEVVAGSAFTGVFYTNGDGNWRNLSPLLPQPLSAVSSVGIDCEAIYVALEGRSVVRIAGYHNA